MVANAIALAVAFATALVVANAVAPAVAFAVAPPVALLWIGLMNDSPDNPEGTTRGPAGTRNNGKGQLQGQLQG